MIRARLFMIVAIIATGVRVIAQHTEPSHAIPKPASAMSGGTGAATTPRNTTSATNRPDLKTVVGRIQKRIDEEVGTPAPPRPAPAVRPKADAPAPSRPAGRVHLVWRVTVDWPDELTRSTEGAPPTP